MKATSVLLRSVTLLVLLCSLGCGGVKIYPVKGSVVLDDKAIEGALVVFSPQGGGEGAVTGTATTNANGEFKLTSLKGQGIPAGSYKITITKTPVADAAEISKAVEVSSDNAEYMEAAMGERSGSVYAAAAKNKDPFPAKYNSASTLQETVAESDDNVFDFVLKTKS
ncbi:carboxypeptidase-like regulatory domain-containing protein [Aureliella helgolandensis]|uniref:Carboxypeptidase regulatory-like domain-containing protein n=1 Tax=Aureliella helgolandensis TaxID=2527968 RepID=A0A518GA28_9BACT|nr:carboxypeptidase-like regulatory domain-containing protein [Aureliella helgolandensis]QDV25445.1 hypothetical protein Q31a_37710 [Aureliella helgolandensis]